MRSFNTPAAYGTLVPPPTFSDTLATFQVRSELPYRAENGERKVGVTTMKCRTSDPNAIATLRTLTTGDKIYVEGSGFDFSQNGKKNGGPVLIAKTVTAAPLTT